MPVKKLLLSVGAMKAGTTFLYLTLHRHPELYFTPEKELHYFAHTQGLSRELQQPLIPRDDVVPHFIDPGTVLTHGFRRHRLASVLRNRYENVRNVDVLRTIVQWYAERYLFDPINTDWFEQVFADAGDRWAAEFSNYNSLLSDEGWQAVREHCEQLKVIYVLRDPVGRLWSHMKFELLPAGKRDALIDGNLDEVHRFLATGSSAHARYDLILDSLRRNLAPDELLLIRLEDVVADIDREMERVSDFLGIRKLEYANIDPNKKVNKTEDLDVPVEVEKILKSALVPQYNVYNSV
ncbi:MAG: sulfotransferase [Rhizobiaceae bacterium]